MLPFIPKGGVVVDLGCGTPPRIINELKDDMDFCIGLDSRIADSVRGNVQLIHYSIDKRLPVEPELADVVVMPFMIGSLQYPRAILRECYRILKPAGVLLITADSKTSHGLKQILSETGFRGIEIQPFLAGLAYFTRAIK